MSAARWRTPLLALVGLALTVVLAIGAALAWRGAPSSRGELPYVPLATDKSLGVNADLSGMGPEEREGALSQMEEAGFRWLRLRFPWDQIEPERGIYRWTPWDEIVEGATRHNLSVLAVLDGSPGWARAGEDAGNRLAPPGETRDFGDFVATFASRYAERIDHYQIWDEPNIAPHWGAREVDPAAYARLLREGAIRVRAADPAAVVLLAALAPNVEPGGANMSDLLFLDALYRQGAAEWFNLVGAQPYSFGQSLDAAPDRGQLNWNRPVLLRQVMEAHGDTGTAIWSMSFGVSDGAPEAAGEAVQRARQDWPWLGPMLWAAWSPKDAHGQHALVGADGTPGPVYAALQAQAKAAPVAWPSVYPADHASGHYEGKWAVTPSGADIGASGDRLAIRFWGTRLDLTVRRGDYRAFLFASVDGQPVNALPRDVEGRGYVVLYDPLNGTETITLARGLRDGEHVAEIVAERGWGQWAIVGWSVSREAPGCPGWLPPVLGLAAVLVSGATAWAVWPQRHALLDTWDQFVTSYRALDNRLLLALTAAAALLVYVMAGTLPTLAALAVLTVLLVLQPEMGLPLIAVALPFTQLGRPLLGKVFSMVEILTLLTALGWLVHWAVARVRPGWGRGERELVATRQLRLTTLDWGVLALVGVGLLSLFWAEQTRVAAREFRTVVLEAGIYYGLLRAMVRGPREAWRVADAWVLGGALIAVVGLFQWVLGENLITAEGVWRVRGFYGSPNNLALYLGRVWPLAVAVAAWGSSPSVEGQQESHHSLRRWAYAAAALLMSAGILLTYSRGAWLLGIPAALLFLAAMRRRRVLAVTAALLILVVVAVVLLVGLGRLTSLLDTAEGTTFFRLQLWQSSWAMVRDQPLLGVGLDNFLYAYRSHYVLPTAWEEFNLSHPHNVVLDFWLRLGLMGLAVLVWLVVAFSRRGFQAYRRLPEGADRMMVLGLMGGMVNVIAHGLVDNSFFLVDLAFAFVLMLALVQVQAAENSGTNRG